MPELPDFDQIARTLLGNVLDPTRIDSSLNISSVVERLRLVWNARGAADLMTAEAVFLGTSTADRYVRQLDRAIRSLDR